MIGSTFEKIKSENTESIKSLKSTFEGNKNEIDGLK